MQRFPPQREAIQMGGSSDRLKLVNIAGLKSLKPWSRARVLSFFRDP